MAIFILCLSAALGTLLIFNGSNFGTFEHDYFTSHLVTIDNFFKHGFIIGTKKMFESASGSLPLYLYSNLTDLFSRRVATYFMWCCSSFLLFKISQLLNKNKEASLYLVSSFMISPMMISSTAWCLSEITAIFLLYLGLFFYLIRRNFLISIIFPGIILSRQNLLLPLIIYISLFRKNISKFNLLIPLFTIFLAVLFLINSWGGLVPSGLERHLTPSIKSFYFTILISSLYFLNTQQKKDFNIYKIILSIFISYLVINHTPPLFGGGFIFSRIIDYSLLVGILFCSIFLYIFFHHFNIIIQFLILVTAITLSTTNYVFLKYVDLMIFFMLPMIFLVKSMHYNFFLKQKINIISLSVGLFYFQCFSLASCFLFYMK